MYLHLRFIAALLGGLLAIPQAPMPGRADATASMTIRAEINRHTSLRVSSSELRFDVTSPDDTPATVVDFTAGARTYRGGHVVLTVEPDGAMESPQRGPAADAVVVYQGEGGNIGTLSAGGPQVVARWIGSEVRSGRVSFALHGARIPGTYSLSLKFVLSTP
jgi:hypothetical protein